MNDKLIAAFEICLAELEQGSDLEECLQRYPDLAETLRPQLQTLLRTKGLVNAIQPPPGAQEASRAQFLLQAEKRLSSRPAIASALPSTGMSRPVQRPGASRNGRGTTVIHPSRPSTPKASFLTWLLHPMTNKFATVFAALAMVILAGAGVLQVSAESLPGTPFYGVKRLVENTQLVLSATGESRARLEGHFSEQHYQEARQVTERGWNVPLEFGGILDAMEGGRWSVDGITVVVLPGAEVKGNPAIGLYVDVHGTAQPDRTVLASQVTVEGVLFQGRVDQIETGFWRVEGRTLFMGDDTHKDDHLAIGDQVEVSAWQLADGGLLAERIRLIAPKEVEPDSGPAEDAQKAGGGKSESTSLPSGDDNGAKTAEPTHLSGVDDHGGQTPEPTHLSGGNQDDGGKTPEPTQAPSANEGGGGAVSTETPHSGGSGKTVEPSRPPQPTQPPAPTHTPNSGGSPANPSSTTPRDVKFQGVVQSINGSTWVVAGQSVQVDAGTAIEKSPKVGDNVEVEATVQPDGSLLATRIRVKN
jgi:hypothetical protein